MARLPADRTKLNAAIVNQQPSIVASAQANREALIEAYDTIDMLYNFTAGLVAGGTLQPYPHGLYRNAIINGNFDVWQRGTSFSAVSGYTADRWKFERTGTGQTSITRSTDVPSNGRSKYSLRFSCEYAPGEVQELKYFMEGKDAAKFAGQQVTISIQHKESVSAGSTSMRIIVAYATAEDNFASVYQVGASAIFPASANYAEASYTLTLPSLSSGGHPITNGIVVIIRHTHAGTSGTLTGNLSQVQLCTGDVALPFQPRSIAEELALCQRYFEKTYSYDVAPGTVTNNGIMTQYTESNYLILDNGAFKVPKRVAPTVKIYSPSGAANKIQKFSDVQDYPITGVEFTSTNRAGRVVIASGTGVAGMYCWHWTADAEL